MDFLKALVPVVSVIVAAIFARSVYFRQKEYELVRERYLHKGVDQLCANVEYALGTVRHNYARLLQAGKFLRDADEAAAIAVLRENSPHRVDPAKIDLTAGYRLNVLARESAYGRAHGELFALANKADNALVNGFDVFLRRVSESKLPEDKRSVEIEKVLDRARAVHAETHRFVALVYRLQDLGRVLERKKLSFAKIDAFAEDSNVRAINSKVKELFPAESDEAPWAAEH